jgi:aconitate hydratase
VANLINAGILPLTFADGNDYDMLQQGHVLRLEGLREGMAAGRVTVVNETTGSAFTALCDLTERQRSILLAGGLLNYTKEGGV